MADLSDIIEKLEKAEGPSRIMDYPIHEATNPPLRAGFRFGNVPSYTSSIDAAASLAERVLPNWQVNLSIFHDTLSEASFGNREAPHARSHATKPALAICLATLRALQQKGSSNG